jgi:NAD(P)-dependent dehydrogenase (short-subunit alcohol dehydrogenase family)
MVHIKIRYKEKNMKLNDKVAILTGSASGITRAVALEYLKEGARVVFADIDKEGLKKIEAELKVGKDRYLICPTDLTKKNEINAMMDATLKKFATVDILVNYVGDVMLKPFTETTDEDFEYGIKMILQSTVWCIKAVMPIMQKNNYGKIINSACIAAKIGLPNSSFLCMNRHAIVGLTKALAVENGGYNINVNTICASLIKTGNTTKRMIPSYKDMEDMIRRNTPLGRLATAEEIARLYVFMASEESAYMTGQAINFTGGLEMR